MEMQNKTKSNKYRPPLAVEQFVQAMLTKEAKGNKMEAERISGVDRAKFYYHMKNHKEFRQWFSEECDSWLSEQEGTVAYAMMNNIIKGCPSTLRTYYQLRGKLKNEALVSQQIGQQVNSLSVTSIHGNVLTENLNALSSEEREKMREQFVAAGLLKKREGTDGK